MKLRWRKDGLPWYSTSECGRYSVCLAQVGDHKRYTAWRIPIKDAPVNMGHFATGREAADLCQRVADARDAEERRT